MVDSRQKQRVVVVDDNPAFRSAAEAFLESLDSIELVGTAADGAQGLELVLKLRPDTAIVDVSMPVMGGLELVERLNGHPEVPAIILASLNVDQDVRREAERLGVQAVVRKAEFVGELPAILDAIVEKRSRHGQR
jgi:CheY-like chemotaxis protein